MLHTNEGLVKGAELTALFLSVDEVVVILHGDKLCQASFL